MYIEKVQLKNFGKFHEQTIEFKEGLNVIYGPNESGKTTLHSFLLGMLFGIEKPRGRQTREDSYHTYEPWNSASYYVGNMIFHVADKRFFLERNFYHKEKTAKLVNLEDNEELSVEYGDLEMLLGGITKEGYENTYCIGQAGFLADESLAVALENYMSDVANTGDGSIRIAAALDELKNQKRVNDKQRKQLTAERENQFEKLSTEAQMLKKDIAFQKNSELAKSLRQQEENQEKQIPKEKKEKSFFFPVCVLLWITAVILFVIGNYAIIGSVGCVMLSLFLLYIGQKHRTTEVEEDVEEPATPLLEGIVQLQEQWKEKENHYYNIEEQLQELSEVSVEERELEENNAALDLAMDMLNRISTQIYDDVSDELHEAVSKNLSAITKGKYDSIFLDEGLHLYIWENGKRIPVSQLSRGTLEQAYLAMRMAVGDILMKEETMPLLLDETFSMYDDERLEEALRWLSGHEGQVLLFSCQKRELDTLDRMGITYHRISI